MRFAFVDRRFDVITETAEHHQRLCRIEVGQQFAEPCLLGWSLHQPHRFPSRTVVIVEADETAADLQTSENADHCIGRRDRPFFDFARELFQQFAVYPRLLGR